MGRCGEMNEDFNETEREEVESDEPISEPFDPSQIKVDREVMSIFQVLRKIEIGEIKLDPDFQRNLVWDDVRQSRLIESILLRIPLPAFYLDALEPNEWVVVDGLQRLSTLESFVTKHALHLRGLEFLGRKFESASFSSLPRSARRDIEETQLTLYIIRPETPPKVKFTIFHRINTGGMVLTAQEIRHATFPGRAPRLLRDLAEGQDFLKATDYSVGAKRMDDRECVLRHLAFRMHPYTKYSKPDLNDFLGSTMDALNGAESESIVKLVTGFKEAMNACTAVFGRNAFRKFNRTHGTRGPVNKALFESWSTAILDFDSIDLNKNSERIVSGFEQAIEDDRDYLKSLSLSTGGLSAVRKRFSKAYQILDRALS
jgi:hypothetical protein